MQSDRRTPNRLPPTFWQRSNPLWWACDVDRPEAWPCVRWFIRNPFVNFTKTIIGVAHCYRTVYYTRSPWTFAESGWNLGYTVADGAWLALPFISYRGRYIEVCIGWKTSGDFGMPLRAANAKNAGQTP